MTSYSRLRLILDSHPGAIYSLNTRITQAGLSLPDRSMVVLASEVKELRGSLPGEYAVAFRPSRRNQRTSIHRIMMKGRRFTTKSSDY